MGYEKGDKEADTDLKTGSVQSRNPHIHRNITRTSDGK